MFSWSSNRVHQLEGGSNGPGHRPLRMKWQEKKLRSQNDLSFIWDKYCYLMEPNSNYILKCKVIF